MKAYNSDPESAGELFELLASQRDRRSTVHRVIREEEQDGADVEAVKELEIDPDDFETEQEYLDELEAEGIDPEDAAEWDGE